MRNEIYQLDHPLSLSMKPELGLIVLMNFLFRSREFVMAESKIKAESESNDKSAGKQVLDADEATLKGKETYNR